MTTIDTLLKIADSDLLALADRARAAPRRRLNLNVHATPDDPVNRLFNAVEPDSYVRPHRHAALSETLLAVRGSFDVLFLDDQAVLLDRVRLGKDGLALIEYPANTWHSLVALESGSIFFEVKRGPYEPLPPQDFMAGWPAEQDPQASAARTWLRAAQPGDRWTAEKLRPST